jgi:general secretion pathway protein D
VLKVYAELVGRTVLRPTQLPAPTITLETQTPLTRSEARAAIDAVLALNGISVINVGDKFVKVVPAQQAGQVGAPFSRAPTDQLPDLGQFVTHVVQTTYVKPSELIQTLQPFASAGMANGILAVDTSQILVLRDYSENIKRMLEMIKKVDVSVPSEYISEVIPIKYALASEIANALNSLSSGGGGGTTVGGAGAGMSGGTTTRSGYGAGGYGSRMGSGGYGSSYGGLGSSYGGGYGSSYGGYGGGYRPYSSSITPLGAVAPGTTPAAPGTGGTFSDRLQRIIQKASKEGEIQVLGQTKIIADERTNSLLIFASRDDMKTIKDIVAKLDVVLAQVLIEAVIIEVSLGNSRDLAFSYLQKSPQGNYFRGIGAINNRNGLSASSFTPALGGSSTTGTNGVLPSGFSYLASLGGDLDISVTAFASDSRARILQRPRIQTSHAVPAVLFVGESRPYPSGSYYGGGAYGSYASIQQLQIGVTLQVTPLINPDGLVVMDIDQQIDSFKNNVTIQGVGDVPVTSSKHATAKVAVRDHDTIMLGGLIENTKNSSNSGVPFLKDIPLIGPLFRSTSQDSSRSELIVLIRPTVLPTPEVAALTAKAEQRKMPEVNRMQAEFEASEANRAKRAEELKRAP